MRKTHNKSDNGGGFLGKLIKPSLAAAAGWIAYSKLFVPKEMALPPAVAGEQQSILGRAGRLNYYVAGAGSPLLLMHSINAAASAYEVRPLFEHYRASRRVYALDLPGFGFSERSDRDYTPRLYTDAILDMLDAIEQDVGPLPVDALAISLSCEFLARAASEHPAPFRTLALMTPTAFSAWDKRYGEPGSTRTVPFVRELVEVPLWSRPFFDLLNSPPSQRFFLMQTFGSYEAIDKGLLDYDYSTAHQPGAEHAPYAFISGRLFSGDINRVYESLTLPVWVPYGKRGSFSVIDPTKMAKFSNWSTQAFETGALPHFEQLAQFVRLYDRFMQEVPVIERLANA